MPHLKFEGLVNTESSSAFTANGFHVHQLQRAIYCLVNLQAITFLLLYCHIKWFFFILSLCVSSQCHYHLTEMSLTLGMPIFPVFLQRITSLRKKLELQAENKSELLDKEKHQLFQSFISGTITIMFILQLLSQPNKINHSDIHSLHIISQVLMQQCRLL